MFYEEKESIILSFCNKNNKIINKNIQKKVLNRFAELPKSIHTNLKRKCSKMKNVLRNGLNAKISSQAFPILQLILLLSDFFCKINK